MPTIDWLTFSVAFILLYINHGIADYWLQTDFQAQNKSKGGPFFGWWNLGLLRHLCVYTLSFLPALWVLHLYFGVTSQEMAIALASIYIPHGWMDRRRFVNWFCQKTKGWRKDGRVDWPVTGERMKEKFPGHDAYIAELEDDRCRMPVSSNYQAVYVTSTDTCYFRMPNSSPWTKFGAGVFPMVRDLYPIEAAVRVHVTIALDQKFHILCLGLTALYLAL